MPLTSESLTITLKRCKIGGKLVLITNRKSHMSFRLVPNLVTLNDLERRYGSYFALFQRLVMYHLTLGLPRGGWLPPTPFVFLHHAIDSSGI